MNESVINQIQSSEYFDSAWYLEQYPDVKKTNINPVVHYLNFGWKMGRNPSQRFDGVKYLRHHSDVKRFGINPLVHYIQNGISEGRVKYSVNESFDRVVNVEIPKKETIVNRVNDYFDNIYVVNLEKSIKERLRVTKHLKERGVKFQRWEATNGYEGEPLAKFNEYKKRELGTLKRYSSFNEREIWRGKGFLESAGAIGYIFTYINILKDAQNKGYKKFLILEDDIILSDNFDSEFTKFINTIDPDWKVLQLGASQYGWNSVDLEKAKIDGFYFPRQLDTCGSFAIALKGDIVSELIEAELAFEAPFDHLPLGEIYERYLGKCYVVYPNIVMPDVTDSNIREGRDQCLHAEKMRWIPSNFKFPLPTPSVSVLVKSAKNLKYASIFSKARYGSFNLRLYALSIDGLRPVHNFDNISWIGEDICSHDIYYPKSDYWISLNENDVLYEEDIEKYLISKISEEVNYSGPLFEHKVKYMEVVLGRVSVIIPTYKRPTNLSNALRSVAEQNYSNKEIIVINDTGEHSEYNTEIRSVVAGAKKEFPDVTIKFIEHSYNRNGAAARNTGILFSSGEFVCFLDDDDIYLPGRLSESVTALLDQRWDIGGVYCGFLGWNSPVNDLSRYSSGDLTKELLMLDYSKHYLHTNTATYKREALLTINGFDESYRRHQDFEMNLRFFNFFKIKGIGKALVRLNPEPSDISNKVFNADVYNLKNKFLSSFKDIINAFDADVSNSIYEKHWDEVVKYINDKEAFKEFAENQKCNGLSQLLVKL